MSRKRRQRPPRQEKLLPKRSPNVPNGTPPQVDDAEPHWQLAPTARDYELGLVATSLADIADSTSRLEQLARERRSSLSTFQRESRRISVQVRKLLLEGDEQLLKRCFIPRLHPLKAPQYQDQDMLSEWIGNIALTFSTEGSTDQKTVEYPTDNTHEITVRPLYGLNRTGDKQYRLANLFDWSSGMIRAGQLLTRKVLQVDEIVLSADQLLRMMVNREGAHSNPNELLTALPTLPVKLTTGTPSDDEYTHANCIKFNGMTYPQIFTYLFGIYLVSMMKASLKHIPRELSRTSVPADVWQTIIDGPSHPFQQPLKLDRDFHMGAVFQVTREGFAPVGDYGQITAMTIQIPDQEQASRARKTGPR